MSTKIKLSPQCEDLLKKIQAEERTIALLQSKKAVDLARRDLVAVRDDQNGIDIAQNILNGLLQQYGQMGCGALPPIGPHPKKEAELLVTNLGAKSSILRYNGTTGAFAGTLAEIFPTGADANWISDLITDWNGNVYALVADWQVLKKVDSAGTVTDFANITALVPWSQPSAVAFGPDENFYVTDSGASIYTAISKYSGSTGVFLGQVVPVSEGVVAGDLIFGLDGNLYNGCFFGDNRILQISPVTGAVLKVFASTAAAGILQDGPGAMVFGPDGDLYVGATPESRDVAGVLRFDGSTGKFKDIFVKAHSGGLNAVLDLAFSPAPDHDLFISNSSPGEILRYDGHTGAFKGVFVPPGSGGLSQSGSLLFL